MAGEPEVHHGMLGGALLQAAIISGIDALSCACASPAAASEAKRIFGDKRALRSRGTPRGSPVCASGERPLHKSIITN
jgi:hypothetical protein